MSLPFKIVVAHKNINVFNAVKSAFGNDDAVIHYTSSGLDALMSCRNETYNLLVCGEELFVISGTDVIQNVRKCYPEIRTLFILDSECDLERALSTELLVQVKNTQF